MVNLAALEVTFGDFKQLMDRRQLNRDEMVTMFRGKIEDAGGFLDRISTKSLAEVVIPYRSVLTFYFEQMGSMKDSPILTKNPRLCICGCGLPVWGAKRYASGTCQKRVSRRKVTNSQNDLKKDE